MSTDATTEKTPDKATPEEARLDAATAWAHASREDGPHVLLRPRLMLSVPFQFRPDSDGRTEERVELPENETIRVPAGAPLVRLVYAMQFNGVGAVDEHYDGLDLHPRLAMEGEEAVREALRAKIESIRSEAARKLVRAAELETLLAEEWEVAWPAYWTERGG